MMIAAPAQRAAVRDAPASADRGLDARRPGHRRRRARARVGTRLADRGAVLHRRDALRRPARARRRRARARAPSRAPRPASRTRPSRRTRETSRRSRSASRWSTSPGEDHTIDKPRQYELWRDFEPPGWPGPLLGWTTVRPETHEPLTRFLFEAEDDHPWWRFRRILDRDQLRGGLRAQRHHGRELAAERLLVRPGRRRRRRPSARATSRRRGSSASACSTGSRPRRRVPTAASGYPGLRLRGDVVGGTPDGLAPAPYVRESRRIRAEFTVLEQHIAHPLRPDGPELFARLRGHRLLPDRSPSARPAAPATSTSAAGPSRSRSAR